MRFGWLSCLAYGCAPFADAPKVVFESDGDVPTPTLVDGVLAHPDLGGSHDKVWVLLSSVPDWCTTYAELLDIRFAATTTTDRETLQAHATAINALMSEESWTLSAYVNVGGDVEASHPIVEGRVQLGDVEGADVVLYYGLGGEYVVEDGREGLELRFSPRERGLWELEPGGSVVIEQYDRDVGVRGTISGEVHSLLDSLLPVGAMDVAFEVRSCPVLDPWLSRVDELM